MNDRKYLFDYKSSAFIGTCYSSKERENGLFVMPVYFISDALPSSADGATTSTGTALETTG